MEFFTRVLSGSSRLKERIRDAEDVNQAFKANLDILQRLLESEESSEVIALLDMVYDSSYPEEQIFMKTPNRARLQSKKELVVRLLIGLDALGIPVMAEMLLYIKKHGMEAIAVSLLNLLELLAPLLAGKEAPEFTTDDVVDAMDFEWHSSSRAMSPLLSAIASVTSSPRASAASVNDSPFHSIASASPYRRAFSDRSMLLSQSHEIGSKSILDKSSMESSSSYKPSLTTSASSQYPSASSQYPFSREVQPQSQTSSSSSDQPSNSKTPGTSYTLETVPLPSQPLERKHRRKSSSLRDLFAEDTIDEVSGEGSAGTSSKRNSASSSQRRNSSEILKTSPLMNESSPTLNPVFVRGDRRSFGKREEALDEHVVTRIPASERLLSLSRNARPLDDLATSAPEDAVAHVSSHNDSKDVLSYDEGASSTFHDVFNQPNLNSNEDKDKVEDAILLFSPNDSNLDDTAMSSKAAGSIIKQENTKYTSLANPYEETLETSYLPMTTSTQSRDISRVKEHGGNDVSYIRDSDAVSSSSSPCHGVFVFKTPPSKDEADVDMTSDTGKASVPEYRTVQDDYQVDMCHSNAGVASLEVKSPELDAHSSVIALVSTGDVLPMSSLHDARAENLKTEDVDSNSAHKHVLDVATQDITESMPGELAGDRSFVTAEDSTGDMSPLLLQHDAGDEDIEPVNLASLLTDEHDASLQQPANEHGAKDGRTEVENPHSLFADAYEPNGTNQVFEHTESEQQIADSSNIKCSSSAIDELESSSDERLSNSRRKNSINELDEESPGNIADSVEPLENANIESHCLRRSQSDLTPVRTSSMSELFFQKNLDGSQTDNAYFEEIRHRFANRLSSVTVAMESLPGSVSSPDRTVDVVMHKSMPWMHERNQNELERANGREKRSMSDVSVDESVHSSTTPSSSTSPSSSMSSSSSGLEARDDEDINTEETNKDNDSDKEKVSSQSSNGGRLAGIKPERLGELANECLELATDINGSLVEKGIGQHTHFTEQSSELIPQRSEILSAKYKPLDSQLCEGGFPCSTISSIILSSSGNEPQKDELHAPQDTIDVGTNSVDGANSPNSLQQKDTDKTDGTHIDNVKEILSTDVESMLPSEDVQNVVTDSVDENSSPVLLVPQEVPLYRQADGSSMDAEIQCSHGVVSNMSQSLAHLGHDFESAELPYHDERCLFPSSQVDDGPAITLSRVPTDSHDEETGLDPDYHVPSINHIEYFKENDAFTIKDVAVDGEDRSAEVLLSPDFTDLSAPRSQLLCEDQTVAESAPLQVAARSFSQRLSSPIGQTDWGFSQGLPQQVYMSDEPAREDEYLGPPHLLHDKVDEATYKAELEEHLKCSNNHKFEQLLSELDSAERSVYSGNESCKEDNIVGHAHEGQAQVLHQMGHCNAGVDALVGRSELPPELGGCIPAPAAPDTDSRNVIEEARAEDDADEITQSSQRSTIAHSLDSEPRNGDGEALGKEFFDDRTLFPYESQLPSNSRDATSPWDKLTDAVVSTAGTVDKNEDGLEKPKTQLDGIDQQLLQGNIDSKVAACWEASEVMDAGSSHPWGKTNIDGCAVRQPNNLSTSPDDASLVNDSDQKFSMVSHGIGDKVVVVGPDQGRPNPSCGPPSTTIDGTRDVGCQTDAGALDDEDYVVHDHPTSSFPLGHVEPQRIRDFDMPRIETWDTAISVPMSKFEKKQPSGLKKVQKIIANIVCCTRKPRTKP